jgi:hypothetical protein
LKWRSKISLGFLLNFLNEVFYTNITHNFAAVLVVFVDGDVLLLFTATVVTQLAREEEFPDTAASGDQQRSDSPRAQTGGTL